MSSADLGPIHSSQTPPAGKGEQEGVSVPPPCGDECGVMGVTGPPPVAGPSLTGPPLTGPPLTGPPLTGPPLTGPPLTGESAPDRQAFAAVEPVGDIRLPTPAVLELPVLEPMAEPCDAESAAGAEPSPKPTAPDPMAAVDPAVIYIQLAADEPAAALSLWSTWRFSRPWMASSALHAAIVIILALIPLFLSAREELILELSTVDTVGQQTELALFEEVQLLEPVEVSPPVVAELEIIEAPTFQLEPLRLAADLAIGELTAPNMGAMLSGRQEGMKEALLATYGGSEKSEAAVFRGLEWLHRSQGADGMWSLSGQQQNRARTLTGSYSNGAQTENRCAATAMAMLAFQGYGQTHQDGPRAEFRRGLARALKPLLGWQDAEGSFTKNVPSNQSHLRTHQRIYTQALCTLALCELYAMTEDSMLRLPAQRAIDYLVRNQDSAGGWRYVPGSGSDLSVSGWVMMALQSARMGGLEVPQTTFYRLEEFLERVAVDGGSRYGYTPGSSATLAMTAEGLLCRQYLGWRQDNKNLLRGIEFLRDNGIETSGNSSDFYYWYYATQVLHNIEGEAWKSWNAVMARQLPEMQIKKGRERGSWAPQQDVWGHYGGRLYTTCLAIYMLEVYYRHLPIYSLNLNGG